MKKLLYIIACITSLSSYAQSPWTWASAVGGSDYEEIGGRPVAVDKNGNVYVTGSFSSSSITFGTTTLTNSTLPGSDLFIVKYNAAGVVQWAQSAGGNGSDVSRAVAVDTNGDVYITGSYTSASITFGATTFTNATSAVRYFITKYSTAGIVQWAAEASNGTSGYGIATDKLGNVYTTGTLSGTSVTIGTTTLTNAGTSGADVFVAKYATSTGGFTWAMGAGGTGNDQPRGVATDGNGDVVVAGSYASTTMNFGSTSINNGSTAGAQDVFVAKYSPTGTATWAVTAGGTATEDARSMTIDGNNDIYLAGSYLGSFSFASTTLTNAVTQMDGMLLKFNSSGAQQWAKTVNGSLTDITTSVATDKFNNVFVSGYFESSSVSFATGYNVSLSAVSLRDAFIAKYNSGGTHQWASHMGANAVLTSTPTALAESGIAVDTSGHLFIAGLLQGGTDFAFPTALVSAGQQDIYIARLNLCTAAPAQASISGPASTCIGFNNITYSIPAVPGATSYTWTLPSGWTGNSTTNSITVNPSATSGAVTVVVNNMCGSTTQSLNVTVNAFPSANITPSGNATICQGSSITLSVATGTAYLYQWGLNGNAISGATNSSYSATQAGTYQVVVTNAVCSTTSPNPVTVIVTPSPNAVITLSGITLSTPAGQGSYQWFVGTTILVGATNNTYNASLSGNYYVVVTNSAGCTDTSNVIPFINAGINDIVAGSLHIYPQPNDGHFIIELPSLMQPTKVTVMNIQGTTIGAKTNYLSKDRMEVQLNDAAPGVYFVTLVCNEQVYQQKVLVR